MAIKKDPVAMTLLFDYYGSTLTAKQSEVYESYHCADLSLTEIAENLEISRQGVHDLLIRGEKSLLGLEDKLGLVKRFTVQKERKQEIEELLYEMDVLNSRALSSAQMAEFIRRVRTAMQDITGE